MLIAKSMVKFGKYGTGILILKSMVQGYLLRSIWYLLQSLWVLWYRGTYFEVYGTGVLTVKAGTGYIL